VFAEAAVPPCCAIRTCKLLKRPEAYAFLWLEAKDRRYLSFARLGLVQPESLKNMILWLSFCLICD
jgi:hypothetical protein